MSAMRGFQRKTEGLLPGDVYRGVTALALLTVLTLWTFRQHLFHRWSFPWDFLGAYSTTPAFVADTIGRGHPLFWSPFVASGFPVDVSPQAGVYFPIWWLLGLFHVPATLRVLTAIQVGHVLLGAVGMFMLARVRGLRWEWATVAAVAYLFFGGFYGQAEHADIVRGFGYLPWFLWALTPPVKANTRWTRLLALPALAWLIVSGAYPGELVSFTLMGVVYLVVALWVDRHAWRQYRGALLAAGIACAAVCAAVWLPYVRAEQAGELYRTVAPTAAIRSIYALSPIDIFGLYLNNFAWTYEGTVTAWAVGIPVLIGIACAGIGTLRRQAPLVAAGVLALVLGMGPKIGVLGRAMASVRPLFPSRFPSSDYKAIVAVALIVIAADAWRALPSLSRRRACITAGAAGCVLIAGVFLVPKRHGGPTDDLWLVIAVTALTALLAVIGRRARIVASVLVVLIAVDGSREVNDYHLAGTVSPWQVPASALGPYFARNALVRSLSERLQQTPTRRPARAPSAPTAEADASGWLADSYHETDYDATVERVLWRAEHNATWSAMLLAPWQAYTFSCAAGGCQERTVHLPAPSTWHPSNTVNTLRYGTESITYSVDVAKPTLMVENELAIDGWLADTPRVHPVHVDAPFRAWRLGPGKYSFTASYHEPGRAFQWSAALIALVAWLVSTGLLGQRASLSSRGATNK